MYKSLFSLFLIFGTHFAWSMTELCGVFNNPTTLKKKNSPYLVTGDLYVPTKSRLTIESGVVIYIGTGEKCSQVKQIDFNDKQMISIKADGSIFIKGTPEDPVVFKPETWKYGEVKWEGIFVRNKNRMTAQMEYFQIFGADKALRVEESNFNIVNALFEYNNTGIYLGLNGNVNVANCQFSRNLSAGIFQNQAAPNIYANQFYYNQGHGIWSDSRKAIKIWYNNFYGNGDVACYHCPVGVQKLNPEKKDGLIKDDFLNTFLDPMFENSPSENRLKAKDLTVPTLMGQVKDTNLAKKEAKTRNEHDQLGVQKSSYFKVRGFGPYRLGRYTPLKNQGPDGDWFYNEDGTRADIGLHGGQPGRVGKMFPFD